MKENFLPILKFTWTSPATPMWSPFAVFTEIGLGVVCDVNPSVATVSIFMQLISAPESNKHENTYPPVSILNVVPLVLPDINCVDTTAAAQIVLLVCSPSVVNPERFPDDRGSSSPVA